jgi:hypothetical protein
MITMMTTDEKRAAAQRAMERAAAERRVPAARMGWLPVVNKAYMQWALSVVAKSEELLKRDPKRKPNSVPANLPEQKTRGVANLPPLVVESPKHPPAARHGGATVKTFEAPK